MSEVTRLLAAVDHGDSAAAERLLPLVYDELRRLAAAHMAREKPEHTLDATALVHEAYLRLVGGQRQWSSSRHFLLAAAEAMRRILVENARRKKSLKRGGQMQRVDFFEHRHIADAPDEQLVALDLALEQFAQDQPRMAELVKLRFFAGLTLEQAAASLDISVRTAKRDWTFARAWLRREMDRTR